MRSKYWDTWKGAAIVAVVLIHATNSTAAFPNDSFNNSFAIYFRQIINFPVGLFIFLAAYFSMLSEKRENTYTRITRRLQRLLLPYLVWSAIYSVIKLARGNLDIAEIPVSLLTGSSVSVGYFVIVMMQLSVVSPLFERWSEKLLVYLMLVSLIISIGFTYSMRLIYPDNIWSNFPYSALPFFLWLPFYIGGLLSTRKGTAYWIKRGSSQALLLVVFLICLSMIEATIVLANNRSFAISQLKLTSMLTTAAICFAMVSYLSKSSVNDNLLSWVGRRSFYFYLAHMIVLGQIMKLLGKNDFLYQTQIAFVLLSGFFTLVICYVGALLLERVCRRSQFSRRALGLI